jgi:hypothetical protein
MDRLAGDMGEVRGLVLEPEEAEAMPATTLTEREQAYFGPRTDKPPGSVAWCWQTIGLMQSRWEQRTRDDAGVKALVDELRQYEAWNVVPPEEPYGSLEVLLSEELGLASVGDMLQEALWNLEHLEAHYRATPQLFELHQQGFLTLKDACLHFAALVAPAELPAPAPEAPDGPPFDPAKYILGTLCPQGHAYGQTGQSLRQLSDRHCLRCDAEKSRQKRQRQKQAAGEA